MGESALHMGLKSYYKEYYKQLYPESHIILEARMDGYISGAGEIYIADVAVLDNRGSITNVLEIQTRALGRLAPKVKWLLSRGIKVLVVAPIVVKKTLNTYNSAGSLLRTTTRNTGRKLITIAGGLLSLAQGIPLKAMSSEEGLYIDVPFCKVRELRRTLDSPEYVHGSHHKKTYITYERILDNIEETIHLRTVKDYCVLLPEGLPEVFCAKDLMGAKGHTGSKNSRDIYASLRLLCLLGVIEIVPMTDTRTHYYRRLKL